MPTEPTVAWDLLDRAAWESVCGRFGRSAMQQGWDYGEAVRLGGATVHRLTFGRDPRVPDGVAQVALKRYAKIVQVALLQRGPLGHVPEDVLEDELRRRYPGLFLLWSPIEGPLPGSRVVTGYATAWLDLRDSADALLAAMDVRWRHRLKRIVDGPLRVVRDRDGGIASWLMTREMRHRREVGYRGPHPAFTVRLRASDPRSHLVLAARLGTDPVGGIMIQRHGISATYLVGWTDAEGKRHDANRLLLWRAAEILRGAGVRWLDLGGIATDKAPGPTRFKLQTGAEPVIEPGTWLRAPHLGAVPGWIAERFRSPPLALRG